MYRLALVMLCGCSFGVRGGLASTTSGKAQATGTMGFGVGKWGTAALLVTPEVALTAGGHGGGVAGGTGFDLMLEQPSHDLGFYVGPRFLAEYDGSGAAHEAVEAGLLLATLSHRIDRDADVQKFLAPSWDRRSTRRTQVGVTVRYDRVRRFDDSEPVDNRVLVGLTLAWSDVHGYTDPTSYEAPVSAPRAPARMATQTITETFEADPQRVLAALVALSEQQDGRHYLRSRTDFELVLKARLGRREDTGALVEVEVTSEIALAPAPGGTQLTAHVTARAPEADEAVRTIARDLPLFVRNTLLVLPPQPAPSRVTMIADARAGVTTARWDECAVYPTHPSNPADSVDAPLVMPDGHPSTVHFRGVTIGVVPGEPAWAVYAGGVDYDLGKPFCGPGGPSAALVDAKVRLDGTPAFPRLATDAFAAADAIARGLEAPTEAAQRAQAIARVRERIGRTEDPEVKITRSETGAWHDGKARFTFSRSAYAELQLDFAQVVETIVIDVDLRSSAPPVVVSNTVQTLEGDVPQAKSW